MTYLGTCWVCHRPILDRFEIAWSPAAYPGGPRKRVHRTNCLAKAEVQSTPKIEGEPPM